MQHLGVSYFIKLIKGNKTLCNTCFKEGYLQKVPSIRQTSLIGIHDLLKVIAYDAVEFLRATGAYIIEN